MSSVTMKCHTCGRSIDQDKGEVFAGNDGEAYCNDHYPVRVEVDLTTMWSFHAFVASADRYDPEVIRLALEKAYEDGADWGELEDHDFSSTAYVDGEVVELGG